MEIRIEDIKQILKDLLNGKISREDASLWAYNLRQEADGNKLVYYPEGNEEILWESILFIEGIDLQNTPNVYLHNREDIQAFWDKMEPLG
ncbi:hypothetical protein SAMN04488128_102394 [Chitinophaga eiseniae]|uniref:Uncharacterized protein n=1 Tax=Chitinophaga eiseniae TaxID=634771 RepID=A0A1T4QJ83_9BACT|nr:hypothetical protein [Chitinophaga eiseniae]SKA03561.1 hypothetical protein SAMN04488128_102394 [Chitinophaga eiseniae]